VLRYNVLTIQKVPTVEPLFQKYIESTCTIVNKIKKVNSDIYFIVVLLVQRDINKDKINVYIAMRSIQCSI